MIYRIIQKGNEYKAQIKREEGMFRNIWIDYTPYLNSLEEVRERLSKLQEPERVIEQGEL